MKNSILITDRVIKYLAEGKDSASFEKRIAMRVLFSLSIPGEEERWENIMEGEEGSSDKLWMLNNLETIRAIFFACIMAYPDGQFLKRLGPRLVGQEILPSFIIGSVFGSMDALEQKIVGQTLARNCSEFWEIIFSISANHKLNLPFAGGVLSKNLSDLAASSVSFFKQSGGLADLRRRLISVLSREDYKSYFSCHTFTPKGNFLAQVVNELSFKSFTDMSLTERLKVVS